MKIIAPKPLIYNTTNLAEDTTPEWDVTAGYAIDTIRQKDNKLYKALDFIEPLAQYVHDDSDPLNPHYTYTIENGPQIDNTAVPCTLDETVVYNKDDNKYYIFDVSTGATLISGTTYAVDFTTQNPSNPPNFSEVTGYRHEIHNPTLTPLKWQDLGYANKYKCLDDSLSSQTESNSNIEMSFLLSKVDSIYLFNLVASSVDILVTSQDGLTTYYDDNVSLESKDGGTFYNYFFNDFIYETKAFFDIPIAAIDVKVSITFNTLNGVAKIGNIVIGRANYLGGTNFGASIGSIDFSKKTTNENGETYIEEGAYKRRNQLTITTESGLTDRVVRLLDMYRATPIVFAGTESFKETIVYGIYKTYDMVVSTPTISKLSLKYESLI
jgi:hypothetical protein